MTIGGTEDQEPVVLAQSLMLLWIQTFIPGYAFWTLRRPPRNATVIDVTYGEQTIQSTLREMVIEQPLGPTIEVL